MFLTLSFCSVIVATSALLQDVSLVYVAAGFLAAIVLAVPGMFCYDEANPVRRSVPTPLRDARRNLLFVIRTTGEVSREAMTAGLSIRIEDLAGHLEALFEDGLISAWSDGVTGTVRAFSRDARMPDVCPGCSTHYVVLTGDGVPRVCENCGSRVYHREKCSLTERYPPTAPPPDFLAAQGCGCGTLIGLAVGATAWILGVGTSWHGLGLFPIALLVVCLPAVSWLQKIEGRLVARRMRADLVTEIESGAEVVADIGPLRIGGVYDLEPVARRTGLDPEDLRAFVRDWLHVAGVTASIDRSGHTMTIVGPE